MARRLNLSVRTVETHRLNLRRKTQTGRLKDLVALARHLGLAPVTEPGTERPEGVSRAAPSVPWETRRWPVLNRATRSFKRV